MSYPVFHGVIPVFLAEYRALTARFRKNRHVLPVMLFSGAVTLTIALYIFIEALKLVVSGNGVNSGGFDINIDFMYISIFINSFISFVIPITVPITRIDLHQGQFDVLLNAPIKPRSILLGIYLSELVIISPFICFLGTIILVVLSDSVNYFVITPIVFFVLFLLTATGLWLGLILTQVLSRFNIRIGKTIITFTFALISLFLLVIVDLVLKNGFQSLRSAWLVYFLPPFWAADILGELLFGMKNWGVVIPLLIIIGEFLLTFVIGIILSNKIGLKPGNTVIPFKSTFSKKHSRFPLTMSILFRKFFRDSENLARLFLALVFSTIVLYIIFSTIDIPFEQISSLPFGGIFLDSIIFFALIGSASSLVFLEASYFSIENISTLPVLLGIPGGIKKLCFTKWIQVLIISLPLTIASVFLVSLLSPVVLPMTFTETCLYLYLSVIGLSGLLLGIFLLSPVSSENDIMNLVNSSVFFILMLVYETIFLIIQLIIDRAAFATNMLILLPVLFIVAAGGIIFFLGVKNLENFDIGNNEGPYTAKVHLLAKIFVLYILTWIVSLFVLFTITVFTSNIVLALTGYYFFVFVPVILDQRERFQTWLIELKEAQITTDLMSVLKKITEAATLAILMYSGAILLVITASSFFSFNPIDPVYTWIYTTAIRMNIGLVLVLLIIAAISEELFFRYYMINTLEEKFAFWPIILLISAVSFAILHFATIISLINALWLGTVLAIYYEKKRSLSRAVIAHFCYNFLILLPIIIF
ncbi:MAG: lysostaphin resistance A-like protein [Candidatus Hodarchaeales archaeon]